MIQKYAGRVFDIYSDSLMEGAGKDILEKVGNVEILDRDSIENLPDEEFAFVGFSKTGSKERYYPVCDPDSTKMSMYYFDKFASSLSPVNRLTTGKILFKASTRHGIQPTEFVSKIASMSMSPNPEFEERVEKTASSVPYAVEWKVNEDLIKAFPMGNRMDIEKSASMFSEKISDIPAPHRRMAALNLSKACEESGVPKTYEIMKYASSTPSKAFLFHVETRKAFLTDPDSIATLEKIAMSSGVVYPDDLASALDVFDRLTGLDSYYDNRIPDAWSSVFGAEKIASLNYHGNVVTAEKISSLIDSGGIDDLFDEGMRGQFRNEPLEIFESLPVPSKEVIVSRLM